jgi:hypothetical protein
MKHSNEDSVFQSLRTERSVRNKSQYSREKIKNVFQIKFSFTTNFFLIFCSILIIPITKLILGIIYYKHCPIRPSISNYVIISAVLELALILLFVPVRDSSAFYI